MNGFTFLSPGSSSWCQNVQVTSTIENRQDCRNLFTLAIKRQHNFLLKFEHACFRGQTTKYEIICLFTKKNKFVLFQVQFIIEITISLLLCSKDANINTLWELKMNKADESIWPILSGTFERKMHFREWSQAYMILIYLTVSPWDSGISPCRKLSLSETKRLSPEALKDFCNSDVWWLTTQHSRKTGWSHLFCHYSARERNIQWYQITTAHLRRVVKYMHSFSPRSLSQPNDGDTTIFHYIHKDAPFWLSSTLTPHIYAKIRAWSPVQSSAHRTALTDCLWLIWECLYWLLDYFPWLQKGC